MSWNCQSQKQILPLVPRAVICILVELLVGAFAAHLLELAFSGVVGFGAAFARLLAKPFVGVMAELEVCTYRQNCLMILSSLPVGRIWGMAQLLLVVLLGLH